MTKIKPRYVPTRPERYMGLAFWIASFSKDPDTQIGTLIISNKNIPLGYGYNGPPQGVLDLEIDWMRTEKQPFMRCAEANAITYSHRPLDGSTLYTTARPCVKCILDIVAEKIKEVIYFPLKPDKESSLCINEKNAIVIEEIAKKGNVSLTKFNGNLNWMRDRIDEMNLLGVFG